MPSGSAARGLLRRTRITPHHVENLLTLLYVVAVIVVAARSLTSEGRTTDLWVGIFTVFVGAAPAAMFLLLPGRIQDRHLLFTTLADLAIVTALFYLTGGSRGGAHFLLFIVIALGGTRVLLEEALGVATLGGLLFSPALFSITIADLERSLSSLVTSLLSYYAVVFIFHFFTTGQREADLRRSQESALADAQRSLEQEQVLIRLSREITDAASLDVILRIVLGTVRQFIPFSGGSLALLDANQRLYIAASDPPVDEDVRSIRQPIGEGISGWIAQHQQPYYSPDLDTETQVAPQYRDVGGNALAKSYLGVPLIARGHCTGVLQVESGAADAFRLEHQRLLEAVAAQVAGAIENARLLEERRDFSRQLQSVYETAHELTSQFELDAILETFAKRAAEVLDANYAAAATFDTQGQITNFVTAGISEADRMALGGPPQGHGVLGHVFHGQLPLRIDDVGKHPDSVGVPPHHPVMRTLLAAPLIARGERHGAIYVAERRDGQPFTARDEELLMILTAGASAAVSNARLYYQLRRNIEQLYALHQIGQAIGSSLSWGDVIGVFNRDVKQLCAAEAVVISQWNPELNRLVNLSREGQASLLDMRERPELHRQLSQAAQSGQSASLSLAASNGTGSRLYGFAVPLYVHGRVLGLAEIYSYSMSLVTSETTSLFLTLVSQLGVSMDNARLYGELQRREHQLRNFVGRLFTAQDDERRRMAYDIHDGLAQLIVSADMHLSNFASIHREDPVIEEADLQKGLARLKAALAEVRRVVAELRPSTLDDFGLANTLRRHVEELAQDEHWEFSFEENLGSERLDPTLENGVFRIVQESLNNVRKHSATRKVHLELKHEGDMIRILVQDWGKGFDPERARQLEGHFGLSGIEERARLLGGSYQVESHPGEGTVLKVELPYYPPLPNIRDGSAQPGL